MGIRFRRPLRILIFFCSFNDRILGTPSEESWPGVSSLPDYKPTFPQWSRQDLARIVNTLGEDGLDMLKVRTILRFPFSETR
jgi:hypothetical protein